MLKFTVCVGIPASSKSTWAKEQVSADPEGTCRINRDAFRIMFSNYHFTKPNERLVTKCRDFAISAALKQGYNVIVDETGLDPKHWGNMCKIAKEANVDCTVSEKSFYIDVEEAIERDAKRTGHDKVGEAVVRNFWKKSGKEAHKNYVERSEIFTKRDSASERFVKPMAQDENLPKCIVCDIDGTIANITHRSPYDTGKCLDDTPIQYVLDLVKLHHKNEYKIFFFSGREDKFKDITSQWLNKYFNYPYELEMRETGNMEADQLLKERLFNTHIKDKYNCKLWVDDRKRVCEFVYLAGLPLARVNDPSSDF